MWGTAMRTGLLIASKEPELIEKMPSLLQTDLPDVEGVTASSPAQVVSLAQEVTTRLLVLDDTVAEGEAMFRLIRRVHATRPELGIVCVTSQADSAIEIRLRQLGVLYVMVRPVSYQLLSLVMKKALESDTKKYAKPGTPPYGVAALASGLEARR